MVTYSEPTVTQLEGILRKDLLKRFLRETGLGVYGTATGGSTTTLVDTTRLLTTQARSTDLIGGWNRISKDAGGSGVAPQGEIKPISNYVPSTGTVTIATGTAIASGDEYEIWKFPEPQLVLDFLDDILKEEIFLPHWAALTNIPDGDMEANNTDDWTDSGATSSKVANTAFGVGKRHLLLNPASALDYTESNEVKVRSGDTYHLSAMCLPASGQTARLALYTSAGVLIDYVDHDKPFPVRLWKDISIPASINAVKVRLIGQATGDNIQWDEVVFYSLVERSIYLPWWVKSRNQVIAISELRSNELGSNISSVEYIGRTSNQYNYIDDAFGRGQLRIYKHGGISTPPVVYATRNEEAYSNDHADEKLIDAVYLTTCLAFKVFSYLRRQPNVGLLDAKWVSEEADRWEREYLIQSRKQVMRLEHHISSPEAWGLYGSRYQYDT